MHVPLPKENRRFWSIRRRFIEVRRPERARTREGSKREGSNDGQTDVAIRACSPARERESERERERVYECVYEIERACVCVCVCPCMFPCRTVPFSIQERLLRSIEKQFQGGLACKARRLLYHSTIGTRVITKKERQGRAPLGFAWRKLLWKPGLPQS